MSIKIRPALAIIENGHLLTMMYAYGGETVYNLPGGNLEFGEQLNEALTREMQEELGIEVSIGELLMVGEVHFSEHKKHTIHFIYEGKITAEKPILNPKETSALAIKWLNINNLKDFNLYPNISIELEKCLSEKLDNKYIGKINQQWF